MYRQSPSKGLKLMDKSVPKNKKFAHIQSKLDTGATVDKVKFVTARECSRRRNEIFYRIKREHLYDLFEEYEQDEYESINETNDNRSDNGPRIVTHTNNAQPNYNKPYLILDVREKEDFNRCHLLQARNFPYALLRRDKMHPEVFKFKNVPETLIILYCDDERISSEAAKVFVDRGTDNIFLLTGGMNEFAADFPAFVEGDLPLSPGKGGSNSLGRIQEDHGSPGNKMYALKSECDYSMGGRKGPPPTGRSNRGGSQGGLSRGDLTDRSDRSYRSNNRFRDDVSESGFSTR
jgi:rhodanese-related sulfurtransferase